MAHAQCCGQVVSINKVADYCYHHREREVEEMNARSKGCMLHAIPTYERLQRTPPTPTAAEQMHPCVRRCAYIVMFLMVMLQHYASSL